MNIAIITVGYNRPDSMQQLLNTVVNADYENDKVDLIISIDKGERQSEIIKVAENIKWSYGEKKIRAFSERQGLRNHIIQCGDMTEYYDAVVVLEDDLMVSKYYYTYVKQALAFYCNDCKIAGISLYKHQTHPGVYRPFEPVNNGYDVYMQQFAMSWGQCWSNTMWKKFKNWYLENEQKDLTEGNVLPQYIANWNKQSWLKYYMRYIVEKDKYFVYPYFSLSTNASDAGEHCRIPNNDFQVSLIQGKFNYRLPSFDDAIKYDVFFERIGLNVLSELEGRVILDLYGNRESFGNTDYVISTARRPFKVVKTIQLKYRPIEMNLEIPTEGEGIYVYDLHSKEMKPNGNEKINIRYDVRAIHWKKMIYIGFLGFVDALIDRLKRK